MKIRKFNENMERKYLEVPPYICPVCGEKKNIASNLDASYLTENARKYIIVDFECHVCDFEWYSQYNYSAEYETHGGDEIVADKTIDRGLYNEPKIAAKTYNL